MLECVVNVSEGRSDGALATLIDACRDLLLDAHRDPHHHRAVFTLAGPSSLVEAAVRRVTATAVAHLDLSGHAGSHPRFGVVDVVPFVPLDQWRPDGRLAPPESLDAAVRARDRFARWAADALGLPCFLYGPLPGDGERSLPEVRRRAIAGVAPDCGPPVPHPTAGACAVGARGFLVAYNLWLAHLPDPADSTAAEVPIGAPAHLDVARAVATALRGPAVRALGLEVGGRAQVSCNLVEPFTVGPAAVYDRVVELLAGSGASVARCELVGLAPAAVVEAVAPDRRAALGLAGPVTIEARLGRR